MSKKKSEKIVTADKIKQLLINHCFRENIPNEIGSAVFSLLLKWGWFKVSKDGHMDLYEAGLSIRKYEVDAGKDLLAYLWIRTVHTWYVHIILGYIVREPKQNIKSNYMSDEILKTNHLKYKEEWNSYRRYVYHLNTSTNKYSKPYGIFNDLTVDKLKDIRKNIQDEIKRLKYHRDDMFSDKVSAEKKTILDYIFKILKIADNKCSNKLAQKDRQKKKKILTPPEPSSEIIMDAIKTVQNEPDAKEYQSRDLLKLLYLEEMMEPRDFARSRFVQGHRRRRSPGQLPRSSKTSEQKHDPSTGRTLPKITWSKDEVISFLKGRLEKADVEIPHDQ